MLVALQITTCGTQRIPMHALRGIQMQIGLGVWMTGRVPQVVVSILATTLSLGEQETKFSVSL